MKSSYASFSNPVIVVIADDHPVVREGLLEVFKSQADIKVVAEATNGEDALGFPVFRWAEPVQT